MKPSSGVDSRGATAQKIADMLIGRALALHALGDFIAVAVVDVQPDVVEESAQVLADGFEVG